MILSSGMKDLGTTAFGLVPPSEEASDKNNQAQKRFKTRFPKTMILSNIFTEEGWSLRIEAVFVE